MQSLEIEQHTSNDHDQRTNDELRSLLAPAYEIQASLEGARRRLAMLRITELVVAVLLLGGSSSILVAESYNAARAISASLIVGCAVVAVGAEVVLVRPLHREIRRQDRALHEVVNLIRELERFIAEDRSWSTFQRAELRTRLALFPL